MPNDERGLALCKHCGSKVNVHMVPDDRRPHGMSYFLQCTFSCEQNTTGPCGSPEEATVIWNKLNDDGLTPVKSETDSEAGLVDLLHLAVFLLVVAVSILFLLSIWQVHQNSRSRQADMQSEASVSNSARNSESRMLRRFERRRVMNQRTLGTLD